MMECACSRCQEDPFEGPEYFQCEECGLYGTSDEFGEDTDRCYSCKEVEATKSMKEEI